MEKFIPEHPYNEYSYGYFSINDEGRKIVELFMYGGKNAKMMTYSRYLMSIHLGRILEKWEQVDHKDGDKTNDSFTNLQILSQRKNSIKAVVQLGRGRMWYQMKCPMCKQVFERQKNNTHVSKGGLMTFCSRACGSKFPHGQFSKEQLKNIGDSQIIKQYRVNPGS